MFSKEFWAPLLMVGGPGAIAMNHRYLFWMLIATYLPTVAIGRLFMRNRFRYQLKWFSFVWNLTLSILSGIGALTYLIYKPSVLLSLSLPDDQNHPYIRAVMALFSLSKLLEFGDTYLLILKKKPLIFLHVYHHLTTAVYCWHAQAITASFGHIVAFINLVIHCWMYAYYAMAIITPRHPVLRAVRPYITLSQIIQMFGGMYVAYASLGIPSIMGAARTNTICGLLMYISYAYLFILFYLQNYVKGVQPVITIAVCTMHFAAVLGLKFLWEHPLRGHLAVETAVCYAISVFLVQNFVPSLRSSKNSSSSTQASSFSLLSFDWVRSCLMLYNFWIVRALENQQLQRFYYGFVAKELKGGDGYLVKDLMTDVSPITEALIKYAETRNKSGSTQLSSLDDDSKIEPEHCDSSSGTSDKISVDIPVHLCHSPFNENLVLILASMIIPAIYGHVMHDSALLGFLIHGCFRWCVELYSVQTIETSKTIPTQSSYSTKKID